MHQRRDDDDRDGGVRGVVDREQRPPIDILSDDVLVYLVDGFLDDRSLGACLLAWRRFHVLDRRALFKRKYRWAALFSLCAAGDVEGVDYALSRPDLFALRGEPPFWRRCLELAAAGGHMDTVSRLLPLSKGVWPLDRDSWMRIVLRLGHAGKDDAVVWLCLKGNRSPGSVDAPWLVTRMVAAVVCGYRPGDAARVVRAAWTGDTGAPGETVWARLHDAAQGQDAKLVEQAITGTLAGSQATATNRAIVRCLERGYFGLLKGLVGDARLAAALAHITRGHRELPLLLRDDAIIALWLYERVLPAGQTLVPYDAFRLLDAAARIGRIDVLDRVLASVRPRWPKAMAVALARAYATAALMGHAALVERVIVHDMDTTDLDVVFGTCSRDMGTRFDGARSPLIIHRGRDDLERVLLDRRPPVGVQQSQVDARVDHMIAFTAQDALHQGDMEIVRRLCARSNRDRLIVETTILRLRADAVAEATAVII
ncbi:hypothetical protein pdul_cds_832 [Pandoravirus dulcis]|uniref:Ankyrin repeat domain containing protein n=1 Tax=Pandoravirus dulcis TaxID=1349409 RepID=S4VRQ0_9VIRU|nr:hypothetical protein pdul_cds_832 [Pandoravirus dulcis]AGO83043.1 hypothetical protein pdul_cds_832 [Pandoravirus dulcis]